MARWRISCWCSGETGDGGASSAASARCISSSASSMLSNLVALATSSATLGAGAPLLLANAHTGALTSAGSIGAALCAAPERAEGAASLLYGMLGGVRGERIGERTGGGVVGVAAPKQARVSSSLPLPPASAAISSSRSVCWRSAQRWSIRSRLIIAR